MDKKDNTSKVLILATLVFVAIFSRFLPHPPNFTAIAAVALFAGAHFRNKLFAFAIPIVAMIVSDIIFGWHETLLPVYAAFVLTVGIGILIATKKKPHVIALGAVTGSVLFFLITNFAVWTTGLMYPMDLTGLLTCYAAALPFFQNTLAGDLFFTAILFGSYYLLNQKLYSDLKEEKVRVRNRK